MTPLTPFRTMELLPQIEARRRQGERVFRFDLGEPQGFAHSSVRSGVAQAVLEGRQGYTESCGRPELRRAISHWYWDEYATSIDPKRIIVTTGASAALTLALLAATRALDVVAAPRPAYPAYRNMVRALGRNIEEVRCGAAEGFRLTPDLIGSASRPANALIFASPANPTGAMLSQEEIKQLLAYCDAAGAVAISDEIYQGISFGRPPVTAAADERAFVINSFSKFWRLTGWRVGWLVCPTDHLAHVEALAQHFYLSPPAPSQTAALLALDQAEDCRAALGVYEHNRNAVVATLKRAGIRHIAPSEGAFYVFADFRQYTDDGLSLARRLLAETGVAVAPGEDFDPYDGRTWLRFATTADPAAVEEGLARLEQWLRAVRHTAVY